MNTSTIKTFAQRARREFRKLVTDKAHALGIGKAEIAKAVEHGDALVIHGQAFPLSIKRQRDELIAIVRQQGFDHVIDAMAYTLFNRLCALRFMEVHDYLYQRVLSAKDGGDVPDILRNAADVADKLFKNPDARKEIKELKLDGTQDQTLYQKLIHAQCNALAPSMPFLFEKNKDYSELLMPDNLLHSDSVVRDMVRSVDEADWQEIEIIGWLYQFYISERKDEVIGSVVEKEDIPAATQLFTPKWIVRYMVENSLGRLWLESHPDSPLRSKMPYFIENPDDGSNSPEKRFDTPDEITCMDDACGSGHILVYMFDLLYEMYAECGYPKTEIPSLILNNNLYGLDIDERAVQLASFALMMKAREKDSRFLERNILPKVLPIEESNGIDLTALFNRGIVDKSHYSPFDDKGKLFADETLLPVQKGLSSDEQEIHRLRLAFQPLVQLFHDAKNFGSLLVIPETIKNRLPFLEADIGKIEKSDQLFDQHLSRQLHSLVTQASFLATLYQVCVTNPPYMGSGNMNSVLKHFAACNYEDASSDLMTCFMARGVSFTKPGGHIALINLPSWLFLKSFESFREAFVKQVQIISLIHPGRGVFGSDFGSVCFCVRNSPPTNSTVGVYRRLFMEESQVESNDVKCQKLLDPKLGYYVSNQVDFLQIPGAPIAYWISSRLRAAFKKYSPLSEVADARIGMATGNNAIYVRLWHEVARTSTGFGFRSRLEAEKSGKKWFPYAKGGPYRKWYGNCECLVDWEGDGRLLQNTLHPGGKRIWAHNFNLEQIFHPSIGWTVVTIANTSFRTYPDGFLYDAAAGMCQAKDPSDQQVLLGFLNCAITTALLKLINPTVNLHPGYLGRLPFAKAVGPCVCSNVQRCIAIAKSDWDNFENSWDFAEFPLLRNGIKGKTLETSWTSYFSYCTEHIKQLQTLETENNRHFIEAYGLQDELSPEVPEDQITLARADTEKDIKAFISYTIGCMMGRYSLSKPGLQFAGGQWDESKFEGAKFQPDQDGILPVLNDAYFEDDPTERLAEFLIVTFGKDTLNDNLQFIAQTLGMKGNESPRDTIRRYLAEGFFKDHLRTYKKRPIYWLVTSGKERAFQALIYVHRYTPATLSRMRTAYLHELQNKLNAHVDEVQQSVKEATSTAQANRLNKELIRLRRQQAELLAFDEKLNNMAGKKIAIDLDDGVKHNYALFGDLLAEVKTVCGKDEE